MKSFSQFIKEQKEIKAPYGVIFKGDKVAFVGSNHSEQLKIEKTLLNKIKSIGDKYGYWYEGNGGDVKFFSILVKNKSDYKGSWDDAFNKTIKGYPSDFLFVIFSNPEANGQKDWLVNPKLTIFDSILKNNKRLYFKDRGFDSKTLTKFLRDCSDSAADFLNMSQQKATKQNVTKFIDVGDKRMWPNNWEDYPYNAGKVAYRANLLRDNYLLNQSSGVYIIGASHLNALKDINKSLKLIDGSKIE